MNIERNVVFITGGSSGIGLALAQAFLERSNTVIICGRNAARLESVRQAHPALHTIVCDITDPGQRTALVERLQTDFDQINVLVNNAGVMFQQPKFYAAGDITGQIDQEIATNFTAAAHLTHQILPLLLDKPEAAVVNISSGLGLVPRSDVPVYSGTKAALHAFSCALRLQLRSTSVKVIEVLPPSVDTPLHSEPDADHVVSPEHVASDVMNAMKHNRYEIKVGIVRTLAWINRLSPRLASYLIHH
jgi:uncharacterized oxidoreductase